MRCPYLKKKGELTYFCLYYYKILNTIKGIFFCNSGLCEQCPAFSEESKEYEKEPVEVEHK